MERARFEGVIRVLYFPQGVSMGAKIVNFGHSKIPKPNTFGRNPVHIKSLQHYLLTQAHNSFMILVNLSNLSRCQLSHLKDVCKVISFHLPCCACTINAIVNNICNASKDSFPKSGLFNNKM